MGRTPPSDDDYELRFWSRADQTGGTDACWPWRGGYFTSGYGAFWMRGQNRKANRIAWTLAFGDPPPGQHVAHRCNNKACVNPAHLYLATPAENTQHAHRDGLCARDLTPADIEVIHRLHSEGFTQRAIAYRLNIASHTTVGKVLRGESHSHLQEGQ